MALRLLEYLRRINWSAHNCKMVVNLLTMLKEKGYLPALSKEECKLLDLMSQPFGVFPYAENNRICDTEGPGGMLTCEAGLDPDFVCESECRFHQPMSIVSGTGLDTLDYPCQCAHYTWIALEHKAPVIDNIAYAIEQLETRSHELYQLKEECLDIMNPKIICYERIGEKMYKVVEFGHFHIPVAPEDVPADAEIKEVAWARKPAARAYVSPTELEQAIEYVNIFIRKKKAEGTV